MHILLTEKKRGWKHLLCLSVWHCSDDGSSRMTVTLTSVVPTSIPSGQKSDLSKKTNMSVLSEIVHSFSVTMWTYFGLSFLKCSELVAAFVRFRTLRRFGRYLVLYVWKSKSTLGWFNGNLISSRRSVNEDEQRREGYHHGVIWKATFWRDVCFASSTKWLANQKTSWFCSNFSSQNIPEQIANSHR